MRMASPGATVTKRAGLSLQGQDLSNDAAALGLVGLTAEVQQLVGPPDDRNDGAGSIAFRQVVVLQLLDQMPGELIVVGGRPAQSSTGQHTLPGCRGREIESQTVQTLAGVRR